MPSLQGHRTDREGWICLELYGAPHARGYAHGALCAAEFREIQRFLAFTMMESYGLTWPEVVAKIEEDFLEYTRTEWSEWHEEMQGIVDGCCAHGCPTTLAEMVAWNFYCSIPYWIQTTSDNGRSATKEGGGAPDRCSAFMAVGPSWTQDGGIVCAHNSFTEYIEGQHMNVVVDMRPTRGHRFVMQTCPCWIWSGTDFFITEAGIIGTETTIGGFLPYAKNAPIGYRIRQAMQYGRTLDEYCEMLLANNAGDYANSWLFGNIHTNEILRLELGLQFHRVDRTRDGYFIGFNAPYDERIRNLEVSNSGFYDIRRHQGARMVRLGDLMDQYRGRLNLDIARRIIADHYDVYLQKDNHPCSRTVCAHYDLDERAFMSQADRPKPFQPRGAVDGIVCDSELARRLQFWGRMGSSCGRAFHAASFCRAHRQYAKFAPYLHDRPSRPWTLLPAHAPRRRIRTQKRPRRHNSTRKKGKKNDVNRRKKDLI